MKVHYPKMESTEKNDILDNYLFAIFAGINSIITEM